MEKLGACNQMCWSFRLAACQWITLIGPNAGKSSLRPRRIECAQDRVDVQNGQTKSAKKTKRKFEILVATPPKKLFVMYPIFTDKVVFKITSLHKTLP